MTLSGKSLIVATHEIESVGLAPDFPNTGNDIPDGIILYFKSGREMYIRGTLEEIAASVGLRC